MFTPEQRQHREEQARRYQKDIEDMGAPPADESAAHDFHVLRNFLLHKLAAYTTEPTVEQILHHDQSHQQRIGELMKTRRYFQNFPVQAAFKTHHNKGRRGVVKDERDSDERRKWLAALTRKGRTPGVRDIKGILCIVQWDATNTSEEIPIENLVHPL